MSVPAPEVVEVLSEKEKKKPQSADRYNFVHKPKSIEFSSYPIDQQDSAKILKKYCKSNPLVPIGLGVTLFALINGVREFGRGNKYMSMQMMRLRVTAQAITIAAIFGGFMYNGDGPKFSR